LLCSVGASDDSSEISASDKGNVIHVYSTVHFAKMVSLKTSKHLRQRYRNFFPQAELRGHNGHVTSLRWSSDDSLLVSAADDGSIYHWDIMAKGGARLQELVIKTWYEPYSIFS